MTNTKKKGETRMCLSSYEALRMGKMNHEYLLKRADNWRNIRDRETPDHTVRPKRDVSDGLPSPERGKLLRALP